MDEEGGNVTDGELPLLWQAYEKRRVLPQMRHMALLRPLSWEALGESSCEHLERPPWLFQCARGFSWTVRSSIRAVGIVIRDQFVERI